MKTCNHYVVITFGFSITTTLIHISAEDVFKELRSIDVTKASGPDNIPGRLLKEGAIYLAKPLSDLFNVSLLTGSLPSDCKRVNVTPVFKKGSRHTPSNYRPVSLTSTVIKILERIIHRKIARFLNKTNQLHDYQHGFRTARSCQTQLLTVVHEWARSLNSAKPNHVVFLDFSKAFDSVPHCRLLLKLQCFGISGMLLPWIESFLTNRFQRVVLDGQPSEWAEVTSGVPQGSILGPLFFVMYVNDIGLQVKSTIKVFADDCAIYREIMSSKDQESLQLDITAVHQWSQKWQTQTKYFKMQSVDDIKQP